MADFTASVPLNMRWRDLATGTVVEIVQDRRAGIPLAAGATFTVPDAGGVADRFEAEHGPQATVNRVPLSAGIMGPETTTYHSLISGLVRIS